METSPAHDTATLDVSGGYAYLREQGTDSPVNIYNKGWVVEVTQRIGWVGFVGELGASYRLDSVGARQSLYGFLGGVRFRVIRVAGLNFFAQALVGQERFSAPGFNEHGAAFQPGAGIDVPLVKKMGVRVQGDYRIAQENLVNYQEFRLTAGVVVGIR